MCHNLGLSFCVARVVELVDARDSKSRAARRAGSIPAPGTTDKAGRLKTFRLFSFSSLETCFLLQLAELATRYLSLAGGDLAKLGLDSNADEAFCMHRFGWQ